MIGEMADVEKSVEDTEPDGDVGGVSEKEAVVMGKTGVLRLKG